MMAASVDPLYPARRKAPQGFRNPFEDVLTAIEKSREAHDLHALLTAFLAAAAINRIQLNNIIHPKCGRDRTAWRHGCYLASTAFQLSAYRISQLNFTRGSKNTIQKAIDDTLAELDQDAKIEALMEDYLDRIHDLTGGAGE